LRGNRKHLNGQQQNATPAPAQAQPMNGAQAWRNGLVNPTDIVNPEARRWSESTAMSNDISGADFSNAQQAHVPHSICEFPLIFFRGKGTDNAPLGLCGLLPWGTSALFF
jgi:hypothetical protein